MAFGVSGADRKQVVKIEGHHNKVHQLIEKNSKSSVYQKSTLEGRYNLVIQIVGDIPPQQLDAFLRNADDRQELARQLDLTEKALVSFTEDILEKNIDIVEWPGRLKEVATRYHTLKDQIDSYEGNDLIIAELKFSANSALSKLDWKSADRLLEQAATRDLEIAGDLEKKFRQKYLDAAESTAQRAEAVLIAFEYLQAADRYLLAANRLPDGEDLIQARYLNNAAINLRRGGHYKDAAIHSYTALEIRKQLLGEYHPITANSYNAYANILYAKGDYDKALALFRKSLKIRSEHLGDKHPDTVTSYNNVATILADLALHEEAELLFRTLLEITRQTSGKEHPDTATSYNNLAYSLSAQNKFKEAAKYFHSGLEIFRAVLGEEHPKTAKGYNNVAFNLDTLGKYKEAEPLYRKVLVIFQKVYGTEHPVTATGYNNLAYNLKSQERYNQAEPLYRRALEIRLHVLREEHPDTAAGFFNLASNLDAQGRFNEAGAHFHKAVELIVPILGPEHPTSILMRNRLNAFLQNH